MGRLGMLRERPEVVGKGRNNHMNMIAKYLLKLVTTKFAKRLLLILVEKMVKKTDNTIDNMIYTAVVRALANEPHGLEKK